MNSNRSRCIVLLVSALCATASAQVPAPAKTAPTSLSEALRQGKPSLTARLRYEHVEQATLQDADALTLGLNLGYTTARYRGWQAGIEGESTTPLVKDYFDGTGTNTTPPTATVADPEVYQLNQAWLSFALEATQATFGRQRIVFDNARFVGDVAWRQNQQTFDAARVQDKSFKNLVLDYAYLDRVNRVFDDSSPQRDWDSNAHLAHAAYSGMPFGTLTGYAYLLDLSADGTAPAIANARAASCQTYGLSFDGNTPLTDALKATYRLEYATQSDYGASALNYTADYALAELGLSAKPGTLAVGYEYLGSDGGRPGTGFKTPLATLHAHNGTADKFLGTPDAGLTDLYLRITATLPAALQASATGHHFGTADGPADLGDEIDLQLSHKINAHFAVTAKSAWYWADTTGPVAGSTAAHQDTVKYWLQADYTY